MTDVNFRAPPLVEVSFGVQFKRPAELRSAHFGLFWSTLGKDFTEASDQPPIGLQENLDAWPLPRTWLVHRDKALLIQIQADRFYVNWRRLQPNQEYPRFKVISPLFLDYWKRWHNFLAEVGVGSVEPIACELSYVNHFDVNDPRNNLLEVASWIVPLSAAATAGEQLPPQESLAWHAGYRAEGCVLTADLKTLVAKPPQSGKRLQFEIKAQSVGELSNTERIAQWMALANTSIVSLFIQLTSEYAQKEVWKRAS